MKNTLFNQIPGYPCLYSLRSREGMTYIYQLSETEKISISTRDRGSYGGRFFSIEKGNKIMIDHDRQLWGDTMQILDMEQFLSATNLSAAQLGCLLEMADEFPFVPTAKR